MAPLTSMAVTAWLHCNSPSNSHNASSMGMVGWTWLALDEYISMTRLWKKKVMKSRVKTRKKNFHSYESSQAFSPNKHKPGRVGAGKVQSTANRNTAKCCQKNSLQCQELQASVFSRKESILVFSYPKFSKYKQLRVPGGRKTMLYRIQST